MRSKWFKLKDEAVGLRVAGTSIRDIEKSLKIPRSTLSNWFKDIKISPNHKMALENKRKRSLSDARKKAVLWHNKQKTDRLKVAENEAKETLTRIEIENKNILDLTLSILYLGEGFKKSGTTGMGNSDPLILKFFLLTINKIYKIPIEKVRCELHLRADQDPDKIKKYWSRELEVPIDRFKNVFVDKRTVGKPTYPDYKGVCIINCGNVSIQRKLVYLSRSYCEKVINSMRG